MVSFWYPLPLRDKDDILRTDRMYKDEVISNQHQRIDND